MWLLESSALFEADADAAALANRMALAEEYLTLVEAPPVPMRCVRAHLFKLMRSRLSTDMEENKSLGKARTLEAFWDVLCVLQCANWASSLRCGRCGSAGRQPQQRRPQPGGRSRRCVGGDTAHLGCCTTAGDWRATSGRHRAARCGVPGSGWIGRVRLPSAWAEAA